MVVTQLLLAAGGILDQRKWEQEVISLGLKTDQMFMTASCRQIMQGTLINHMNSSGMV